MVDTLNDWFSNTAETKFLELNDTKKQIFIKENPFVPTEKTCSICGFLLDVEAEGKHKRWYYFTNECECHF